MIIAWQIFKYLFVFLLYKTGMFQKQNNFTADKTVSVLFWVHPASFNTYYERMCLYLVIFYPGVVSKRAFLWFQESPIVHMGWTGCTGRSTSTSGVAPSPPTRQWATVCGYNCTPHRACTILRHTGSFQTCITYSTL